MASEWDVVAVGPSPRRKASESYNGLYAEGLDAFLSGDEDKALSLWQDALRENPAGMEAQRGLERIQRKRSGPAPAASPESQALYRGGLEAYMSGSQDKALQLWQSALQADPKNLEARRGVERIAGRREEMPTAQVAAPAPAPESPSFMERLAGFFPSGGIGLATA